MKKKAAAAKAAGGQQVQQQQRQPQQQQQAKPKPNVALPQQTSNEVFSNPRSQQATTRPTPAAFQPLIPLSATTLPVTTISAEHQLLITKFEHLEQMFCHMQAQYEMLMESNQDLRDRLDQSHSTSYINDTQMTDASRAAKRTGPSTPATDSDLTQSVLKRARPTSTSHIITTTDADAVSTTSFLPLDSTYISQQSE